MKLTRIIIPALVALLMAACSSDGDVVKLEKTAKLSVNLGLSASSRAGSDGDTNSGSAEESNVQSISIRIHYDSGVDDIIQKFISGDATVRSNTFKAGTADSNGKVPYQLSLLEVYPGKCTIYIIVNSDNTTPDAAVVPSDYSDVDGLTASVAKDNNFVMTGTTTADIVANQVTVVGEVLLNRIVAKMQERSPNTFQIQNTINIVSYDGSVLTTKVAQRPMVTLLSYGFYNLNKGTNLYKETNSYSGVDYLFPFFVRNNDSGEGTALPTMKTISGIMNKNNIYDNGTTYCFENGDSHATVVVYEAVLNGGKNFYVVKDAKTGEYTMYDSFEALDNSFSKSYSEGYGLNDGKSRDEFYKDGILKYESGKCYYKALIKTAVTGGSVIRIVRNNWYILLVNTIANIGGNYVDPKENPTNNTWLTIGVSITPWTFKDENYGF